MAERRMFAKSIVDSDAFLDMPLSAQALYFHLSMRADDEGFVNNPKKIQRMIGASEDDAKLLLLKRFLIAFDTGVVVIKHWFIHNYIQSDRRKDTVYQEEKAQLRLKPNKAYTFDTGCIQSVSKQDTQVRIELDQKRPPFPPAGATCDRVPVVKHRPDAFASLWKRYPEEWRGNPSSVTKAWRKLEADDQLIEQISYALDQKIRSDSWQRGIGIPWLATFLKTAGWEDVDPP